MRKATLTIYLEIEGDIDTNYVGGIGHEAVRQVRFSLAGGIGVPPSLAMASWEVVMHPEHRFPTVDLVTNGCRFGVVGLHNHLWKLMWQDSAGIWHLSDEETMKSSITPTREYQASSFFWKWVENCNGELLHHHMFDYEPFMAGQFQFSEKEIS